jgi:hypothetical protein
MSVLSAADSVGASALQEGLSRSEEEEEEGGGGEECGSLGKILALSPGLCAAESRPAGLAPAGLPPAPPPQEEAASAAAASSGKGTGGR